jgi:hypothetical protein
VIELYADWAGPTGALFYLWPKLASKHGGKLPFDLSKLCVERCKDAEVLAEVAAMHQRTCEPWFLLFRGGKQVAFIKGCNPPAIEEAVNKQLAIMQGALQRSSSSDEEDE